MASAQSQNILLIEDDTEFRNALAAQPRLYEEFDVEDLVSRHALRGLPVQKFQAHLRKRFRRLHQRDMAAVFEHDELGTGNSAGDLVAMIGRHGQVEPRRRHQGGHGDMAKTIPGVGCQTSTKLTDPALVGR